MKSFLFCTCNKRNEKKTSFLKMQLKKKTPSFLKMLFHFFSISIFSFFLLLFFSFRNLRKNMFSQNACHTFSIFDSHVFFFLFGVTKINKKKRNEIGKGLTSIFGWVFCFFFFPGWREKKRSQLDYTCFMHLQSPLQGPFSKSDIVGPVVAHYW